VETTYSEVLTGKLAEQNRLFQLEGTWNAICLTTPGPTKLTHVIRGIVQTPLQHQQAWGIDPLSGKPVPVFDHHLSNETLPKVKSEPLLTQL